MTDRGVDPDSPAGQVIQPYVTGTAIIDVYVGPWDPVDFGPPPVFEQDELDGLGGACDPSSLPSEDYCSEIRSFDLMSVGSVLVDPSAPFLLTSAQANEWSPVGVSSGGDTVSLREPGVTLDVPIELEGLYLTGGFISTSTTRGDYRLGNTSPSIDACSTSTGPDLDGVTRPLSSGWDGDVRPGPQQVIDDALMSGEELRNRAEEYAKAVAKAREKELLQPQLIESQSAHEVSHIDLERSEGTILRRLRERGIFVQGKGDK